MTLAAPAIILTAGVTILAALVCLWAAIYVARVRRRHKVQPPAVTGALELECAVRAQANTTEQVVIFLPLLWMAALYFHLIGWLVPVLGLIWCLARIWFVLGYVQAPAKRYPGFAISQFATIGLGLLAIIGVTQAWLAS